jgi:tRNA (cmo5U34)-methyltransferase
MTTDRTQGASHVLDGFKNAEAIANYAEGPPRFVPGFDALHRMTTILLAERAPAAARVLVLGAGGGLELSTLALAQPEWSFVGVDPSQPMLDMARRGLGPLMERVELVHGYIDDAPPGPFDAATCLLTLHFLDAPERLRTARAIHARLKPGAPFVAAHSSFPQDPSSKAVWLARYAAYAVASGADPRQAATARDAIEAHLDMLEPSEDEGILREAGFSDIAMFYAAFTWRGWIARA